MIFSCHPHFLYAGSRKDALRARRLFHRQNRFEALFGPALPSPPKRFFPFRRGKKIPTLLGEAASVMNESHESDADVNK